MRITNPLEREWARRGALLRLQEIQQEQAEIYSSFPELRSGRSAAVTTSAVAFGPRKRRVMSPAAKRAMSAGMRKYWARRKAAEAKKQATK